MRRNYPLDATIIHIVSALFAYLCQFAKLLFGNRIVGLCSQFQVLCGLLSQVIRVLVHVTTSKVAPAPHLKSPDILTDRHKFGMAALGRS
jgi:hypothetical protein